ncbi:MAG: AEC family transporter [Candidatus Hodarchaeota archaeon]
MSEIVIIIFPIVCMFVIGVILRRINLFNQDDANLLIKLVFYVSLPALILKTIPNVSITLNFIILPLIAVFTIILMFIISNLVLNLLDLEKKTAGVFLIGTMILNLGFNVPFVLAAYGDEGFARASFLDIGNILLTLSLTYYLAQRYGSSSEIPLPLFNKKLLTSPPLIALIIAVSFNLTQITFDPIIMDVLEPLSALLTPLLMISIGIYFNPTSQKLLPALGVIFIRMGIGLTVGLFSVFFLELDDLSNKIVIISTAAPVGFNTLTFASLEDLDREFAANVLSISIPIGICIIILLLTFLG